MIADVKFLMFQSIFLFQDNKFEVLGVKVGDQAASVAVVDAAAGLIVLQTWTDNIQVRIH